MQDDVKLSWKLTKASDKQLSLSYCVENNTAHDILLMTPLVDYRGSEFLPVIRRVYVYQDDNGVAQITKRLWPVPDDIEIYMPEVPFLTKVAARNRFSEDLDLPLPLLINVPYRDIGDERRELVTDVVTSVVFSIGYLDTAGITSDSIEHASSGHFRVSYGVGIRHQRILKGEVQAIAVELQDVH